jgi:hypothetical protein
VPLAESVSIDGGALALILTGAVLALALWITLVWLGFRWAAAAGRGSRRAAVCWGVSVLLLLVPFVRALGAETVVLVLVAAQALVFAKARRESR